MVAKKKIDFLRKQGHNIIVREYKRSNGYTLLYIVYVGEKKFKTSQQPEAHKYIDKLYEEVINGKEE